MRRIYLFLGLVLFSFLASCSEDDPETTILVTEEVLLTSGEQVRILGRLITNQAISLSDHGFYLSTDESFSNPIIISLGAKEGPGRFIGESDELLPSRDYFARAFMDRGNGVEFGNTITLQTLATDLQSFTPGFGKPTDQVTIFGTNFTQDTRVFFGSQEAQVVELLFESRLTVRVPEPADESQVIIRVLSKDQELSFSVPFEYQTGSYARLASYPVDVRLVYNIAYQANGAFHLGLGTNRGTSFFEGLYRYRPSSNQWEELSYPGPNMAYGFASERFIGGGISVLSREPFVFNPSFYRIDSDGFTRLSDLPFDTWRPIALEVSEDLYLIGGEEGDRQAIRRYDPTTGEWSILGQAPIEMSASNPHFVYQGRIFVIGSDASLYRYTPGSGSWEAVSQFPGSQGQGDGFARVIGNKVYVGGYRRSAEMWELSMETLNWVPKNPIPGTPQGITAGAFSQGEFIYLLRQQDLTLPGSFPLEFYRFDPNGI
ncbi:IPT/TIG domain-containing protein [Algoriphagus namhaensis]